MATTGTRRTAAIARYIRTRAQRNLSGGRRALKALITPGALNKLKAELELLSTYSNDVIYRLRYDTMSYDYISPSVERLLGYTPAQMRKINFRNLILETRIVTDGLRPVTSYAGLEASRSKREVSKWQADYLIRAKDGHTLWVADVSYPWFDEKGAIIGSVGSLRDITERVEAEARLRAREEADSEHPIYTTPMQSAAALRDADGGRIGAAQDEPELLATD